MKKAENKIISSKALYEIGQYGDSVGRSYYAMFLSAKALLIKKGYNLDKHRTLISIFGNEYVNNGEFDRKIAKSLSGTQSLRDNADYDAIDKVSKQIAQQKIKEAEAFIEECKKFL